MGTVTYDPKCHELAVHFLSERSSYDTEEHRHVLASLIQLAIEDYIDQLDPMHPSNRGFDGPGGAE